MERARAGEAAGDGATINRAAFALGGKLDAFVRETSAADEPRDAVHLRAQELVMRIAAPGGWRGLPEEAIDREARTSRRADVLLHRISAIDGVAEYAISEIEDWIDDVGGTVRNFARRIDALERYAIARIRGEEPVPRTGGCWIVRATRRNRRLVAEHLHFFRARFPGSGRAWLAALTDRRLHCHGSRRCSGSASTARASSPPGRARDRLKSSPQTEEPTTD